MLRVWLKLRSTLELSEVKKQVNGLKDAKAIRKWLSKHKSSLSPILLSYVAFKMYVPSPEGEKKESPADSVAQVFTGDLFG